MRRRWLFLLAYACSGLAGLIYEVSWTRLVTLYMGHTTAATSTVVAAFMGGLAAGAVVGGRIAPRLTRRQCLVAYIGLEAAVALIALLLPLELLALRPLLAWAYQDGAAGALFPAVRLLSCLILLVIPAAGLGATFPLAVRWFVGDAEQGQLGRFGGLLYALNTLGAALGAIAAGFILIPAVGISGTTWVGVLASGIAIAAVLALVRGGEQTDVAAVESRVPAPSGRPHKSQRSKAADRKAATDRAGEMAPGEFRIAAIVLALTGFASLTFEIAWTRVLALTLGPTTYAFATTVAALIGGLACGSAFGAWLAGRSRRPGLWLALVLAASAVAASVACGMAGSAVPLRVAEQVASESDTFRRMLMRAITLGVTLVFPASFGFGAAFPLGLSIAGGSRALATEAASIYAINTVAAVTGSLATGFLLIPLLGLQQTLRLVTALLIVASLVVTFWGRLSPGNRVTGAVAAVMATVMFGLAPAWDHALLASGVYKYSAYVAKGLDLESALKAGELLYYKEGAAATVTVKRLTGTTTLAIDGKVDASNASDMLTQKLIAHLPLLLHENPQRVCVIGVGSGVTLEAALKHPVTGVDVVEISPEVVEASRLFAGENEHALDDARTRLIVGDGRSHLALTRQKYDVIISEPSNPWIAGVASLFTREFFVSAREHLAPNGIISQWAHTYNISGDDLRSIAATFISVFPNGTVWMVGQDDVLLIASNEKLDGRIANIETSWRRPGVAEDLRAVSAVEPFSVLSLFTGGPDELRTYSAGALLQTDNQMELEFSGPRAMDNRNAGENALQLKHLFSEQTAPSAIRTALDGATAAQWRNRAAMLLKADVALPAYDDYARALSADPTDAAALDGLVETAVLADRAQDALTRVQTLASTHPQTAVFFIAKSKLLAEQGDVNGALDASRESTEIKPLQPAALDQLASIFAKLGDVSQLDLVVQKLTELAPQSAATHHHAAVAKFLHADYQASVEQGTAAVTADPTYGATYDVIGAAHLKLGQPGSARAAFEASLRLNPHDSTAYTNLGILELQAGSRPLAARYFAEALWLDPESNTAREGLATARRN